MREYGPEPPSLLARLAPTFIRIGHFEALNPGKSGQVRQIFLGGGWQGEDATDQEGPLGGLGNLEGLRDLAEWCKYITAFEGKSTAEWVKDVIKRNAGMVAMWQVSYLEQPRLNQLMCSAQVYGFMHGVLNSDNISIMGLTIDYGPYAFMDIWEEGHICSESSSRPVRAVLTGLPSDHSDPTGLYSYRRQPERVLFALDKLVQSLAPLIGYETLHCLPGSGWSEGKTKDDVETWTAAGQEAMQGWEKEYLTVVKTTEKTGWLKVLISTTCEL